jgi:fibronectin type 3 domain-containing protein
MNGSSTLTWSSTDATSCTASGAWSGSKPLSGSESVGPLTQDSTFTLSCTGSGGTTSRPVTVTVAAANGTADLSWIAPTTNEDGSTLTLASFNIYRGTSPSNLQKIASVGAGQTTFTVTGLAAGTYYFAVTAVSDTGAESTFSNIESKQIF